MLGSLFAYTAFASKDFQDEQLGARDLPIYVEEGEDETTIDPTYAIFYTW